MNRALRIVLLLAAALLGSALAQAQTCDPDIVRTTPDSDFADAGDGTVRHIPTGLIWKRCAEGQTWNGSTCTGSADGYTWEQAFQRAAAVNAGTQGWNAGQTDWRVPNQKELRSIVERACYNPSINAAWFPATPAWLFWSASPFAGVPGNAWYVYFGGGYDLADDRFVAIHVRLVRAGQYFYNFDAGVTYTLTVAKTGTGSGTVSSSPAGIDCGATCTASFNSGGSVTLTAAATVGSSFTGWSGAGCSGTGTCVVTMDAAQNVTADFALNTYAVTASAGAGGTASCVPNLATHGGSSTCTATPNANFTFSAWTGDCAGQGASCTLNSITSAKSSVASFAAVVVAPTISGTPGNGTVGTAYSFTPTATGTPTFTATGLPPGLGLNAATGTVSGTPTAAGSYNVTITAANAGGVATLNATIVIAAAVATTPTAVPTLSEWALIGLAILLAGVVGMGAKRRG